MDNASRQGEGAAIVYHPDTIAFQISTAQVEIEGVTEDSSSDVTPPSRHHQQKKILSELLMVHFSILRGHLIMIFGASYGCELFLSGILITIYLMNLLAVILWDYCR